MQYTQYHVRGHIAVNAPLPREHTCVKDGVLWLWVGHPPQTVALVVTVDEMWEHLGPIPFTCDHQNTFPRSS